MSEALTTLFVVPTGNTLPVSGTNANLTGTQFGIFLPTLAPATVATAASAKYLTMSQGRNIYSPKEGTKNSDRIYAKNLQYWYKVPGSLTASTQITEITNWTNLGCQEDVSITLRLFSFYINSQYYNGLTRAVLTTTPCCSCGANPCDTITGSALTTVLQNLAQAINNDEILKIFVVAGLNVAGTGLIIEALPLTNYGVSCDLTNFPYQFDRMYFYTFVRSGPELTTDYEIDDICNIVATPTVLQKASYPQNTPAEVQQMEKNFWSYQSELNAYFSNPNYNGEFQTYVDSALAYDLYYLNFLEDVKYSNSDTGSHADEETVIIAIPAGDTNEVATIAILIAAFGVPQNEVATPSSTTTITSSSTTTSSSTAFITP